MTRNDRNHPDHNNPGEAIPWYDENADTVADGYEQLDPHRLYSWISDLFPPTPAPALDIGARTGRDAAWLTGLGYRVTAAEPSERMRTIALDRHPRAAIRWIADRLPHLDAVHRLKQQFKLIVLNAVWMHVNPRDRETAFRNLVGLGAADALIVVSIRHGRQEPWRGMYPASG